MKWSLYKLINSIPSYGILLWGIMALTSCNKLLDVTPKYILTPEKIFSNNDSANFAVAGLYSEMSDGASGTVTMAFRSDLPISSSLSADETYPTQDLSFESGYTQMYKCNLLPASDFTITNSYWGGLYKLIYISNSIIEGIDQSTGMTEPYRSRYKAEALFWRAYYYFYLVNFYGAVPLVLTTDYKISAKIGRTATQDIYKQIVADLEKATPLLDDNASTEGPYRVNKSAVKCLLARVYMFTEQWREAEKCASEVIESKKYSLAPLEKVFYDGNSETILAIKNMQGYSPIAVNTLSSNSSKASYAVDQKLVNAFGNADRRTQYYIGKWQDNGAGNSYFIDFKYRINGDVEATDAHTESTVVLRLAEQYLIRAEARARLGNLETALDDVNVIRKRAQATTLQTSGGQPATIQAVINERRLELCFEWADRWFTLKRTNTVDAVMSLAKPGYWNTTDALYPIPIKELQSNRLLIQNKGYN